MKRFAIIFGVVLLATGIAGFIPALNPNGMLFGIFAVDAMHNVVHIVTGLAALGMAMAGEAQARLFFQIFGIAYAVIAVLGFVAGRDGQVMGMAMNMADHVLHVAIAALSLWLGFATRLGTTGRGPGLSGA